MEIRKIMTRKELENKMLSDSGPGKEWPNSYTYSFGEDCLKLTLKSGLIKKSEFRGLDPWGLAIFDTCPPSIGIKNIKFVLNGKITPADPDFEALKRRVSFLRVNNAGIGFEIILNGETIELYDSKNLFIRPEMERIRPSAGREARPNTEGHIEKDFQTFLFGYKKDGDSKTNERLAVLGDDFFNLQKKDFGIIREFPTGSFLGKIAEVNRVLPTERVDIVTLNKYRKLSVIELKINDTSLEVISQILDYSLFFKCYLDKLLPIMEEALRNKIKDREFVCYVVNNRFHSKFDKIIKYYSTDNKTYGFQIVKVVLGHYLRL